MNHKEYIKEFKKFTLQEQQEIMQTLMPDFCQIIMSISAQIKNLMQMCSQMIISSFMSKNLTMLLFGKEADK